MKKLLLKKWQLQFIASIFLLGLVRFIEIKKLLFLSTWSTSHKTFWTLTLVFLPICVLATKFHRRLRWLVIILSTFIALPISAKQTTYLTHFLLQVSPQSSFESSFIGVLFATLLVMICLLSLENIAERRVYLAVFIISITLYSFHVFAYLRNITNV